MDMLKVVMLSLVIVFTIVFTKQVKPEFALIITISGSVLLMAYVLGYIGQVITVYNNIILKTGVDSQYFTILIKAISVGYLIEFASSVCKDSGNSSIADKIVLIGKIYILTLAIPVINSIYQIISGLL